MSALPFPTVYYVYLHRDLGTGSVLYVGHGTNERAWAIGSRSEEHKIYLRDMLFEGATPDEWVEILYKGLTKVEACEKERTLIQEYQPKFNKTQGEALLKITPIILMEAANLRELGYSYQAIADSFNLSPMTIHRAMAGKSPALEAVLAR